MTEEAQTSSENAQHTNSTGAEVQGTHPIVRDHTSAYSMQGGVPDPNAPPQTFTPPGQVDAPTAEAIRAIVREELGKAIDAHFERVMGDFDTRASNIAREIQQQASLRAAPVEPGMTHLPKPDGSVERRLDDLERDVRNVKAGKHI